jgi:ankyrin repeat protein
VALSTQSGCTHRYYCGRRLGRAAIPGSDGQCGPNNGPQCQSCMRFQRHLKGSQVHDGHQQQPKVGMTVTATSSAQGAPCGKKTLSFSEGKKLTITKLEKENGEWYATCTEYDTLWFPLSSTDFTFDQDVSKGVSKDARVVRGPDWKWGDQDGGLGGVGTVLRNDDPGWVRVKWDRNGEENNYRMGKDCCYDLKLAGSQVHDGFYHPGTREQKGGCVGKCCHCQARCGGGCGSGTCSGDCTWTCCGKTGRYASWPGCTRAGSTTTPDTTIKKIIKDTHVQLTKDYKDHGDASKGPLKPGEVGVVIENDGSSKPFHVRAANGKEWWYEAAAIEISAESAIVGSNLKKIVVGSILKKIVKDTHVQLTNDYKDHSDASKGPLKPGEVGVVIEVDDSDNTFQVRAANGKKWWYQAAAIEISVESPIVGSTLEKIVKDAHVQLTKDYKDHGDASGGPLKPGEVGVVIENDGSSKPFHVMAANGKKWWYKAAAIEISAESAIVGSILKKIVKDTHVQLTNDYKDHEDVSGGPLKPGEVGVVIKVDDSDNTFQVRAANGEEWWYKAAAIEIVIEIAVLDLPTQVSTWSIFANSEQDTGWTVCDSMQCTAECTDVHSVSASEPPPPPLLVAVMQGHQDAVAALMEGGADASVALFFAAQTGRADAISSLVLGGVDPNITNEQGVTAIFVAAENGHGDCIRELILGGANPDATNKGDATPVFAAAQNGHAEAIKALLIAGADPNRADRENASPVFVAAQHGKSEAISTLLMGGADPNKMNKDSITPVFVAAQEGHAGAITALFKGGANVNMASPDSATPIYVATQRGHVEAVKCLLECGADPNIANKDNITPAYIAAQEGKTEVVEALVRGGANVNIASSLNQTPAHVAAQKGHVNALIAIIQGGANLNTATSGKNETPMYWAAKDGRAEVIKVLLQGGAKVNTATSDKKYTPLYIATQNGHNEALAALLQGGADVNIATADGNYTPIHAATQRNDLTALKALLQGGGDVNIAASDGLTPLAIAEKNKFIQAAVVLRACRSNEAAKLWAEKEAAKVWAEKKAEAATGGCGEQKFSTIKLILGSSADSVLKRVIGLEDSEFAEFAKDPLKAIREEWFKNGNDQDKETIVYVLDGKARDKRHLPSHVLFHADKGSYHGGDFNMSDFDEGHDGWTLQDFADLDICRLAGLKVWHVAVLRMYTSSSFGQFNVYLRRKTKPHPFKLSIYYLDEALRMMRSYEAQRDPEAYNQTKILYRGMADVEMDLKEFQRVGGTELAMMSTTEGEIDSLCV